MTQVVRKIPLTDKEYGCVSYVGETETYYLVIQTDREGLCNNQVYAVSKQDWKIRVENSR